jgi:hypothetical protein
VKQGKAANDLACDYPDVLAQNGTYRIPMFIRSSYQDSTILSTYNIKQPVTSEEQPYVTNFDNAMFQSLNSDSIWLSLYGLNSTVHTMIKNSLFMETDGFPYRGPVALAYAIGVWYRDPCSAPRYLQLPTQD